MPTASFKKCGYCNKRWPDRNSFLRDPATELIGYQVNSVIPEQGLFLFNHDCGNTLSLAVANFVDLHAGPIFRTKLTGTDRCPGYCLHSTDLDPCPMECECAYVRELLQLLKNPVDNLLLASENS